MFGRFVESRWMGLAELACAVIGSALWSANPTLSWQPLLIVLLPWIVRLFAGRLSFQRTLLDAPLAVYLLTAAVGVWAAYDRVLAWNKFWLIIGAITICRALANQPRVNLWLIAGTTGALTAILSGYFLFTHDWQSSPTDINVIDQIGQRWMSIRPPLWTSNTDTHLIGGILLVLFPVLIALGLQVWGLRHRHLWVLVVVFGVLTVCGLILAGRRAAWLSAAVVSGLWVLWWICRLAGNQRTMAFISTLTVIGFIVVASAIAFPTQVARLTTFSNRIEGVPQALRLFTDFFWTGGDLHSFAGLYSRYILVIPWLYIPHSYSLYLNTAIEQGVFGLLALIGIVVISFRQLQTSPNSGQSSRLLRGAALGSLALFAIYSLIEDPFYSGWGTLLIFVPAGFSVAVSRSDSPLPTDSPIRVWKYNLRSLPLPKLAAAACLLAALLVALVPSLRATLYSTLGAVHLSRAELIGWPAQAPFYGWGERDSLELNQARTLLEESLALNPHNGPANYRLGLIESDHITALSFLENAYWADPDHRGAQKSLGYRYVWEGRLAEAVSLLFLIPEAKADMQTYSWWWGTQGREDLAGYAAQISGQLGN